MTQHDTSLDFLRAFAAFAVVLLHVSATVVLNHPDTHNSGWWAGNLVSALTRWSVPVFVMISGALLLSGSSSINVMTFYKNRWARLAIPLVFWTVFYALTQAFVDSKIDLTLLMKNIVLGKPYFHLWYLYMIVGLYLFTPFFRIFVQASKRQTLILFCTLCFTVSSLETILSALFKGGGNTFLSLFLPYISYFICGYLLYTTPICSNIRKPLLISVFSGILIAFFVAALYPFIGSKTWGVMYSNFHPLVILMSIACFQFLRAINVTSLLMKNMIKKLAPLSLGVYLIHPFWLDRLAENGLDGFTLHPAIGILITFFTTLALSILSITLITHIPWVRRTV